MPAVCVMTIALHTRSPCVRPTRLPLRTSASVSWTYVSARVTTPSIIREVVQVGRAFFSTGQRLARIAKALTD